MPAAAAPGDDDLIARLLEVPEQEAAVAIADQGPLGHLDDDVGAAAAEAIRPLAVLAPLRPPVALMREMGEVGQALHGADHDVSAATAVAAVGAAPGAYFSRRKLMQPSPPVPPETLMVTRSTNMGNSPRAGRGSLLLRRRVQGRVSELTGRPPAEGR